MVIGITTRAIFLDIQKGRSRIRYCAPRAIRRAIVMIGVLDDGGIICDGRASDCKVLADRTATRLTQATALILRGGGSEDAA